MDMNTMMAESITSALSDNGFVGVEVSVDGSNVAHINGVVESEEDAAAVIGLVETCGVSGVIPHLHVDDYDDEDVEMEVLATYEVATGDSWWKIADTHYGDGALHAALKAANGSPKMLHPGDVIMLPDASELVD